MFGSLCFYLKEAEYAIKMLERVHEVLKSKISCIANGTPTKGRITKGRMTEGRMTKGRMTKGRTIKR